MNAVIVEIKGGIAVALKSDGTFENFKQNGYRIGQTIELSAIRKLPRFIPRLAAACLILVFLLGGTGALAAHLPYSYVTLDVNPSIKYTLNIFDRVLAAEPVDEDAAAIVEALKEDHITNKKLDDVIDLTVEACRKAGYLNQDTADYMVLSVASASADKTEEITRHLSSSSYNCSNLSVEIVPTTITQIEKAQEKGTTPGKLEIIKKMLDAAGNDDDVSAWIDTPVRDIIKATKAETPSTPKVKQRQDNIPVSSSDSATPSAPAADTALPSPTDESKKQVKPNANANNSSASVTAESSSGSGSAKQKNNEKFQRTGRREIKNEK